MKARSAKVVEVAEARLEQTVTSMIQQLLADAGEVCRAGFHYRIPTTVDWNSSLPHFRLMVPKKGETLGIRSIGSDMLNIKLR